MSLVVFLPLLVSLGIFLVPVLLLRNRDGLLQDTCVAPGYTPPEAIRNSAISCSLRLATFGPLFILGATGNFWPVVIGAACSALGVYIIHVFRQPIVTFLERALDGDRSITVHAFIAQQHGNDPRVRLATAGMTLFVLVAAIACEAFALSGFFKLVFGNDIVAHALAVGFLLLAAVYAFPAGHPGVMYAGQLQLGAIFLGLSGVTAFLIYLHASALTPLPPYGSFAIGLAALCSLAVLIYRRSRYIETGVIVQGSRVAKLLSKFGKILNPAISVFVVLVIVLAGMDFSATGLPGLSEAAAAFPASGIPWAGIAALILLPLFYPVADIVHWQRLAAASKNRAVYADDTGRWLKSVTDMLRIYAIERPLLWLVIASLGAISIAAFAPSDGIGVLQAFVQEVASGDNPIATAAFAFLLVAIAAIALSAMASLLSAGLCTLRYDALLKSGEEDDSNIAARIFFAAIVIALILIEEALPMSFTSISFFALVFALGSPVLAFAPLILRPALTGSGVSPRIALLVLGTGVAGMVIGVEGFIATADDAWLWASVPLCLIPGFVIAMLAPAIRAT
jgi:hypothetical protein